MKTFYVLFYRSDFKFASKYPGIKIYEDLESITEEKQWMIRLNSLIEELRQINIILAKDDELKEKELRKKKQKEEIQKCVSNFSKN